MDLDQLYDWISSKEDDIAAAAVLTMLDAAIERFARIGHPGSPREKLAPGLRSVNHKGFNIYFFIRGKEFRVVHIIRGARDISKLDFSDDGT